MSEFNEFRPRLKSNKNRFQLSAGLNLEIEYNFNWYQPNLSRGSNSLNSASVEISPKVNLKNIDHVRFNFLNLKKKILLSILLKQKNILKKKNDKLMCSPNEVLVKIRNKKSLIWQQKVGLLPNKQFFVEYKRFLTLISKPSKFFFKIIVFFFIL